MNNTPTDQEEALKIAQKELLKIGRGREVATINMLEFAVDVALKFAAGRQYADKEAWISVAEHGTPEAEQTVLWCKVPIEEEPYVGSMQDVGFLFNYYTHYLPMPNSFFPPSPVPVEPSTLDKLAVALTDDGDPKEMEAYDKMEFVDAGAKALAEGQVKPQEVWQCQKCCTIYTEYVNGCPKCATGEPGCSYKVQLVAGEQVWEPEELFSTIGIAFQSWQKELPSKEKIYQLFLTDTGRVSETPAREPEPGKWKAISRSYQIADTGDYDGHWEITKRETDHDFER